LRKVIEKHVKAKEKGELEAENISTMDWEECLTELASKTTKEGREEEEHKRFREVCEYIGIELPLRFQT